MAITTAGDLVAFALRTSGINGVGQPPSAEDANTGLALLSMMVAQWQRRRWLVWDLAEATKVSTGATSYTVGPAGDFAVARPDRLESAFVRLLNSGPNTIDYPLAIIESREDYNAITVKNLSTFPAYVFYDSAWPVGVVHPWPVPPAGTYELHLFIKAPLPTYAALTDALNLPPEYLEAALYSLCVRLSMNYGLDPRPAHVSAMRAALNVIRMANTQVATLGMPAGLGGRRNGDAGMVGAGLGRAFILDQGEVL